MIRKENGFRGAFTMSAILHPLAWSNEWIDRHRLSSSGVACALPGCAGPKNIWQRLRSRRLGTFIDGKFYCQPKCLERAVIEQISRLRTWTPPAPRPNRIPLALLMVARGKLTHYEAQAALEAQRRAGYGKIGDWIEKLGFANEHEVTAALALQWGCPLLASFNLASIHSHGAIPLPILEACQMLPANFAASTNTLYMACGERVDHAALYGIEKMLSCRTLACVADRRKIARQLESMRLSGRPGDVEFVTRDPGEMARITSSYVNRVAPREVRLGRIGYFIWLRLHGRNGATNLVFNLQPATPPIRMPRFAANSLSFAALTNALHNVGDVSGISAEE